MKIDNQLPYLNLYCLKIIGSLDKDFQFIGDVEILGAVESAGGVIAVDIRQTVIVIIDARAVICTDIQAERQS